MRAIASANRWRPSPHGSIDDMTRRRYRRSHRSRSTGSTSGLERPQAEERRAGAVGHRPERIDPVDPTIARRVLPFARACRPRPSRGGGSGGSDESLGAGLRGRGERRGHRHHSSTPCPAINVWLAWTCCVSSTSRCSVIGPRGVGHGASVHVACIMDGNGRWAAERGLPRTDGHTEGEENLARLVRLAVTPRHRLSHRVRLLDGELAPAAP